MVIRHPDPLAILLQALPAVGLVGYGTFFLRQAVAGHPPHAANLAILVLLAAMLGYALWKLSPVTVYRFRHSPAKVQIQRLGLTGLRPVLEHDLSRVQRISIERYPFGRGHRYVVCLHLRDGRRIIDGLPDAVSPEPIHDFAVRVARFYGLAPGPGA
ncbi:hypothetical protein SAMN05421721_11132 [Ectothiorhodospira mobilis]|uniref:PH domain-containing protein n=1 Tax=Ectothiorhodospira mobilis TaxID=195064 RepID=A0A1I4RZR5_ECTMO|nr:hypothetical protein [Ectothiorhodospira mobilis]SFM57699.1 hypothetical protein SAMN05421721_11132 [Ectothiorhodospira mobilis]